VTYLRRLQTIASSLGLGFDTLHPMSKHETDNSQNFPKNTVLSKAALDWNADVPVVFLLDVREHQKVELLKRSFLLMYTPTNEHFGIVPVEAMLLQVPVVAVASGGLLETVTEDGNNGLLCKPIGNDFANALSLLIADPNKAKQMGRNGRKRVLELFSFEKFADTLYTIVNETIGA